MSDFAIIDIHAHLLPGLDDGPDTLEESLRMCQLYVQQGVSRVVATPHMADGRFDVSPDQVRNGVRKVQEACHRQGLELEILPGADVHLTPALLGLLDTGRILTIGRRQRYLLLELPSGAVPSLRWLIGTLRKRGVIPIITHPERHPELIRRPDRLRQLVRQGALVQVTAASLLGDFGPVPRRAALRFLEAELVHFLAGDAHAAEGHRRPRLRETASLVARTFGAPCARRLLQLNPARITGAGSLPVIARQGSDDLHATLKSVHAQRGQ